MNNTLVLIQEEAQTKLRQLILNSLINDNSKDMIKSLAVSLIEEYKAKLRAIEADESFIVTFELGMKQTFLRWYYIMLERLKQAVVELPKGSSNIVEETLKRLNNVEFKADTKAITITAKGVDNIEITNLRDYLTINDDGGAGYAKPYVQPVKDAMIAIEREVINGNATLIDSQGRTKSLRNMAEMSVRFSMIEEDAKRLQAKGVKYVVSSAHANASERCSFWQGKIFLVDVDLMSRTIAGYDKRNKPDMTASDILLGYIDGKPYYSLKRACEYGFLGYNCQHKLVEYKRGMEIPQYNMLDVEKNRKLTEKQRYLERQIRKSKELEISPLLSNVQKQKAVERSKRYQRVYESYCKRHDLARYEWRTRITLTERELR